MASTPPRVLFVLPATVRGGAEIRLLSMLSAFRRIEPVLLAHRALAGIEHCPQARYFLDDYTRWPDPYSYQPANLLRHAAAIARVARQVRPALTFGWMHNGAFFVWLARWLGLRGKRAGCILGVPSDYFQLLARPPGAWERFLFARAGRSLDALVTPSQGVRADLLDNFHGQAARVHTIYNGVNLAAIRQQARQSAVVAPRRAALRIISAGRLGPDKGFDVLIAALAQLGNRLDCELVILGEGEMRAALQAQAQQLGVGERLLLPGHVANPFAWYASADVFAFASRMEGFGNALVEAMALGLPVVSTACPCGPREILSVPDSGLLTPVGDVAAMRDALLQILSQPELAARLAAGARKRAEAFDFATMCAAHEALILRTLGAAAA